MNNNPIGILDSGVGGLTVLQAVITELPHESVVYIGDSLNIPYGAKSADEIYNLAKELIEFLLSKKVKLIVIACNTITVCCLDRLRSEYPDVPIVGAVPVVKTAAAVSENKRIGILSTTQTAQSDYQKHLIEEFANGCDVLNYGTDELVPLIEKGLLGGPKLKTVLQKVLLPFQKEDVDTIALGCTHFPLVRKQMQEILGPHVQLLDSGGAIARQVRRVLEHNNARAEHTNSEIMVYTTGDPDIAKKLVVSTIEKQPVIVHLATINI
ncbi:MAG TPA: glutamate racemase [Candidatus Acidoferrales bacterium]|nr:glutamate racemase [Candidatus Acidoferrales bacterium]